MESVISTAALVSIIFSLTLIFVAKAWIESGKIKKKTGLFLALLFLSFSMQGFEFFYHNAKLYEIFPHAVKIFDGFIALWPFFLFGYLSELKGKALQLSAKMIAFHLSIPFIVSATGLPLIFSSAQTKIQFCRETIFTGDSLYQQAASWPYPALTRPQELLIVGCLALAYAGASTHRVFEKNSKGNFSQTYMNFWCISFIVVSLIMIMSAISGYSVYTNITLLGFYLAFIAGIFHILSSRVNLPKIKRNKPSIDFLNEDSHRQQTLNKKEMPFASEENNELNLIFGELQKAMKSGAYSNSGLSLGVLSKLTGFRVQLCSKAINQVSGVTFYVWVNSYRINEAKKMLSAQEKPNISSICYEVGFKSKSTFYSAFKDIEGITPGDYIKNS